MEVGFMIGERIDKLEKFFNVKKPKNLNVIEWADKLYEMELQWEEEHQEKFPI
jgi:hypothetical protein